MQHVVSMFREPRQRAISGFFHDKHMCREASNLREYSYCVEGLVTCMITGIGYPCNGRKWRPEETELAVARVNQMGFVGLTDQWDLSVCLFHAMHGGDCLPVEFSNSRPGVNSSEGKGYDMTKYASVDV